jgi:hypothetical protein
MEKVHCKSCGGNDFVLIKRLLKCNGCGSIYTLDPAEEARICNNSLIPNTKLPNVEPPPLAIDTTDIERVRDTDSPMVADFRRDITRARTDPTLSDQDRRDRVNRYIKMVEDRIVGEKIHAECQKEYDTIDSMTSGIGCIFCIAVPLIFLFLLRLAH